MTRSPIVAVLALALAACGGKSGDEGPRGNAAAAAQFTYGASSAASPTQASALGASVTDATAFAAAPSADAGMVASDPSAVTDMLLGASGYGAVAAKTTSSSFQTLSVTAPRVGSTALTGASFDNPTCVSTTATGVTLSGCTVTVDEVSGTTTIHVVVTASGSMSYTAATHTLAWDLHVGESFTVSGSTTGSGSVSLHLAGSLTVNATTIAGHMGSELSISVSANGQTMTAGVDETVDLNVGYVDAATCATRVVSGTLEAKRVWTARPQGATAADLPDAAAKVTWTGCGTATVQYGTH